MSLQVSHKSPHANDSNDQSYTILQAASISANKQYQNLNAQGQSLRRTNEEYKSEFNPLNTQNSNTAESQDAQQTLPFSSNI